MGRCVSALVLLALCAGCEPEELIDNPWVDRWCGDHPCGWETEGDVRRVGTWHPNDYAVELVSEEAAISFLNADVDESVDCFGFSMLARVRGRSGSSEARAYLEMDFMDDGEVEYSERLPQGDFEPLELNVTPPSFYRGVRFIVRREGPGEVIVARVRAREASGCTGAPLDLGGRPVGAACEADEQCAVGDCSAGFCAECSRDEHCDDREVCGDEFDQAGSWPIAAILRACVDPGEEPLGSPCDDGMECASGVCCEGQCAECCPGRNPCAGGEVCARGEPDARDWFVDGVEVDTVRIYHRCDPGGRFRGAGQSCALGADCASGTCSNRLACGDESCPNGRCTTTCEALYLLASRCQ